MMVLLGTFATWVVGGVGVLKIVVLLIRVDLVVLIQRYTKRFLTGKTLEDIHIIAYQSITFLFLWKVRVPTGTSRFSLW